MQVASFSPGTDFHAAYTNRNDCDTFCQLLVYKSVRNNAPYTSAFTGCTQKRIFCLIKISLEIIIHFVHRGVQMRPLSMVGRIRLSESEKHRRFMYIFKIHLLTFLYLIISLRQGSCRNKACYQSTKPFHNILFLDYSKKTFINYFLPSHATSG